MKQERHFVVDILFVLALFGVFAVSALVLVTIGADIYQKTVSDMNTNYDNRTAIAYITEKIRQSDCILSDGTPAVSIGTLEEIPALVLTDELDGEYYCTYLYLQDGWLRELYMRRGAYLGENMADAGKNILELESLSYEQTAPNLLHVVMRTPDGNFRRLALSLRCYERLQNSQERQ